MGKSGTAATTGHGREVEPSMISVGQTWAEEWPAICRRFRWPAWEPADAAAHLMMDIPDLLELVAMLDVAVALQPQGGKLPHPDRVACTKTYHRHLRSLVHLAEVAGIVKAAD